MFLYENTLLKSLAGTARTHIIIVVLIVVVHVAVVEVHAPRVTGITGNSFAHSLSVFLKTLKNRRHRLRSSAFLYPTSGGMSAQ